MNRPLIKLDLDPTAWRRDDDTHRRHKRHLSYVQAVGVIWFCAGLLMGVLL